MSSEHDVRVVRIGAVDKHPNADTLSITMVDGRPVILRTGEFQLGDLAVYLPVDTLVPLKDPRFAFLAERNRTADGFSRIRAVRLRGTFSMGLLCKPEPDWTEGQDVAELLGTKVYEPAVHGASIIHGDDESDPGFLPTYTDIESLRKFRNVFEADEEVIATEKIHGANARYLWQNDRLWVGSRTRIKREDPRSIWWQAAKDCDLAGKLAQAPGLAIYGEVYGQVQDLKYGVTSGAKFVAFDALDTASRTYLDRSGFEALCTRLEIPTVPVLYRGHYGGLQDTLSNGKSVLAGGVCIREGFVVRPVVERYDNRLGRVIAKLVGEDYLLRK